MPRYKLLIEYDGTDYVGWQRQANGMSVQEVIETALKKLESGPFGLRGAGRTDAGVHASAQVGHIDMQKVWRTDALRDAINAHIRPEKVAILAIDAVNEDFDARFSAKARHYLYRIANRRAPLTYDHGRAWLIKRPLDAEAMHEAAQVLIGHHDFTTFRDSECQAESPLRTLDRLDVFRAAPDEIHISVSSRAFLHRQVRSMVGSLEHVGSGKWRAHDLAEALHAKDRARCGQVAPATGLYLVGVDY